MQNIEFCACLLSFRNSQIFLDSHFQIHRFVCVCVCGVVHSFSQLINFQLSLPYEQSSYDVLWYSFFAIILRGVHSTSQINGSMSFISFGTFAASISSNILYLPFSLSLPFFQESSYTHIRLFSLVPHFLCFSLSLMYLSFPLPLFVISIQSANLDIFYSFEQFSAVSNMLLIPFNRSLISDILFFSSRISI